MAARLLKLFSAEAVNPIGPYSQAIAANGMIYLSSQLPATTEGKLIEGSVSDKSHKIFQNASSVLQAGGSCLDHVVKVNVYFTNMSDSAEFNKVYANYFSHAPARSACEVSALPAGASIALDLVALAK